MNRTKHEDVRLPTVMPDGSRSTLHPLVWVLRNRWKESKSALAEKMGLRPQSIYGWERQCEEHPRKFLLPAESARAIADIVGIDPGFLRPDLWPMKGAKS